MWYQHAAPIIKHHSAKMRKLYWTEVQDQRCRSLNLYNGAHKQLALDSAAQLSASPPRRTFLLYLLLGKETVLIIE